MLKKTSKGPNFGLKTRKLIEQGILPIGKSLEEILFDLRITKAPNVLEMFGFLSRVHRRNGIIVAEGLVSCQKVTQAFTQYLVDSLQNSTTSPMDVFKYHAVGTGTTAEANSQTTLVTEVESRVSGTQVEGASANIFKTVATVTFTGTHAISEHGIFSASANGTMMDRSVLSPVDNVISSDEIEYTYQLTVNAET